MTGATRISNPRVGWIPFAAKTPGDQGGQRRPLNAFYSLCAESAAYICPAESIAGFSFLSVGGVIPFFQTQTDSYLSVFLLWQTKDLADVWISKFVSGWTNFL